MAIQTGTNIKRIRRIGSVKQELLKKSRESALAAVQIFNNPNISFKSEIYIVLMHIAWTYLLHAYYRSKGIDYRYWDLKNKRRRFDRTKNGAYKFWELERCLNNEHSPIDKDTANNLRFLIGIRHEIEHQMTSRIDDTLSAKFQACCLNYNEYIKKLFGVKNGIDKQLSVSLQFSSISQEQLDVLPSIDQLPSYIRSFIEGFEGRLTDDEYNNSKFAYRVLFVAKTANRKGQADQVIEFVKADSEFAQKVNKAYTVIKETEKPKYLPGEIVNLMKQEGYKEYNISLHTKLWQSRDARNPAKGFGVLVAKTWYWYENWVEQVRQHCVKNAGLYK